MKNSNPEKEGEFRISVADVTVLPIGHVHQCHDHLAQTHEGAIDAAGLLYFVLIQIAAVKQQKQIHKQSKTLRCTLSREPSVCVSFCLSDPARSTKFSWEVRMFTTSFLVSLDSSVIVNTAWDLEDSRFMEVEATRRLRQPMDKTLRFKHKLCKSFQKLIARGINKEKFVSHVRDRTEFTSACVLRLHTW